ncbi:hypothetical protein [Leptospira noguchii]|uniref:Uncharacterized protein n=1 Tax=Leptospira noguchii str. 2001034031 TaxID=1193053 RepID=M6Y0V2_9LEPT|nr:hypothetical protein [Leptospira noguchii]EMO87947.1 hypothetical protein LEP1GSC024_0317 [Leptospira noguchii str. 2001034031]
MTNKNIKVTFIRFLLILVALGCCYFCKEKQPETSEIKDKYALPPNYTGSLNPVPYDFEYPNQQWVGVSDKIKSFLGIEKGKYSGNCGILDFEKKILAVRITGTKKDRILKFLYLGNHRIAFVDNQSRGYVAKLEEETNGSGDQKIYYYYLYPLSDISDEKKIDNLDQWNTAYEFRIASIDGSKYKSMNDCEQETIEEEKEQQSIDEEYEKVKGDLAPP